MGNPKTQSVEEFLSKIGTIRKEGELVDVKSNGGSLVLNILLRGELQSELANKEGILFPYSLVRSITYPKGFRGLSFKKDFRHRVLSNFKTNPYFTDLPLKLFAHLFRVNEGIIRKDFSELGLPLPVKDNALSRDLFNQVKVSPHFNSIRI